METSLIQWLAARTRDDVRVSVGMGDDAAVFAAPRQGQLVATVDTLTDGVDFLLDEIDPYWAGYKALGANLSDLAAMAAVPFAFLTAIVAPRRGAAGYDAEALVRRIYDGIFFLAEHFDVALAGGDTNLWDGPLSLSITALGETTPRGPLRRSGGRVGDVLMVTGTLGGSILGRHLRVVPRVSEALTLHEGYALSAGIDVSDGLALDASRLAAASGCGALLDLDSIPLADAARKLAKTTGLRPLDHALGDGEDFELLLTAPPEEAGRILHDQPCAAGITRIGALVAEPGLWQTDAGGCLKPLAPLGWVHGVAKD